MLYIVATPIGNLKDITLRALDTLRSVDIILCEDTRVTRKLLDHYKITGKKLISYHQHSKDKKVNQIIELIKDNNTALVTDAGTPGISDPGNKLINQLVGTRRGAFSPIIPIPGPSAVVTALSVSGFPTDNFLFKGFVPHKKGREKFLREVMESKITVVFYESPYRILKTLGQLCHAEFISASRGKNDGILKQVQDDKRVVVCRELTKKFETIYRGSAEEILEQIKKTFPSERPRGEFVVVIN